jgi:hypothetical protein
MSGKITLVVRFRMKESAKKEFAAKMRDIFAHIVKEKTFVKASLVQDMRDSLVLVGKKVGRLRPLTLDAGG